MYTYIHITYIWPLFPKRALFFPENHSKTPILHQAMHFTAIWEIQKCLLMFGRREPILKLWNNIRQCIIHWRGDQTDVHPSTLGWVRQSNFITVFYFTFLYPCKNWHLSEVLIFFLLFHPMMFYSVGQMPKKICDLGFVILVIFFPLNTTDFFSPSRNVRDKTGKQLHFKNMKIFIHLDPGPIFQDHRTESCFKSSSSQPVATPPCCSNWAIGRRSQGRAWKKGHTRLGTETIAVNERSSYSSNLFWCHAFTFP